MMLLSYSVSVISSMKDVIVIIPSQMGIACLVRSVSVSSIARLWVHDTADGVKQLIVK